MAYSIGYVIFGVDLQGPSPYDRDAVDAFEAVRDEIEELCESEVVTEHYHGNGEPPVFFGVEKGQIDECNTVSATEIATLFAVTDEDRAAYRALLEGLGDEVSTEFKALLASVEPAIFITWGSS